MTKLPTQALSYRPQPTEFIENRTKALWRFALAAAEEEALRRMFSWTYFRRRRDERHQYITLLSRVFGGEGLDQNEVAQIRRLRQRLPPADAVSYELMWQLDCSTVPEHWQVLVDCGRRPCSNWAFPIGRGVTVVPAVYWAHA